LVAVVASRRVKHDVQAVIFVRTPGGPRFLIIERYDSSYGQFFWRLVKGTVRPGETPEEALLREIREEVGLTNVKVLGRLGHYSYEHGGVRHEVANFLVEADPGEPVRLAPSDDGRPLRAYRWAEHEEALELLRWENEKDVLRSALRSLPLAGR